MAKIEKHQKRNQNLIKKIAESFTLFEQNAFSTEQHHLSQLIKRCEHLASFLPKKSLTKTEREALINWLEDDINYLQEHPFIEPEQIHALISFVELQQSLHEQNCQDKITDQDIAAFKAYLDHHFDHQLQLSDEQLREAIVDPSKLAPHIDALHQKLHEKCETHQFEKNDKLEKLFKGSQLNKMYKRLAAKLHPDKAINEQDRREKHIHMQSLSEARKNKDGFYILQLYLSHFDDDPDIDATTLGSLTPLLEEKVRALNEEHRQIKESNDKKTIIWRRFKNTSQKKVVQAMKDYAGEIQLACNEINDFIAQHKTLKSVKSELKFQLQQQEEQRIIEMEAFYKAQFGDDYF